jgi:FAD:protein FMN transferase
MRFPWSARRLDKTRLAMSTFVSVTVEDRSATRAEEAIGRAFEEMERVASLLTRFEASSAVGVLNDAGRIDGPPPELRAVVGRALELHGASSGAFDPTVAPLVDLYQLHFAAHGAPPDERELRDVLELVGASKLHVTPQELRFDRTGMALTLDGVAKGYVVDRMIETIASHGVRHALVNAGGDIRALGPRASGAPWRVGVQDPRRPDAIVDLIELADAAVASSGDYVRFHDVERRYHHTVVPATGRSAEAVASVSVRAPTAMDADALATAVFVLGAEAGCGFVSSGPRAECLVVLRDGSRRPSAGWPAQLTQPHAVRASSAPSTWASSSSRPRSGHSR